MKKGWIKMTSVLLSVLMLAAMVTALPFSVSAAENGFTIHVTSNLFPEKTINVSDVTQYADMKGNVYFDVDFNFYAQNKFLIGVELDAMTWNPEVLEYDVDANKLGSGRTAPLNFFPFAVEQGLGQGVVNTNKIGEGRIVGNFSYVSGPKQHTDGEDSVPYAATAYGENDSPITLVKAIFKLKDTEQTETTVNCDFKVLSLDDDSTTSPRPCYLPINNQVVNQELIEELGCTFVTSAYARPKAEGHSLTVDSGEVNVNFYLGIKDDELAGKIDVLNAEMSWGDKDDTVFGYQTVSGKLKATNVDHIYLASCPVPGPAMTQAITLKLFDENGICVLWDQYGVTSYIKKADKVIGGKPALKQLLCDMLDYGASTQQFFNYYTDDLANDFNKYLKYIDPNQEWSRTAFVSPIEDTTDLSGLEDFGLEYKGSAMNTRAKITVKVYFTVTDADLFANTTAKLGTTDLEFYDSEDPENVDKYLEISNIDVEKIFDGNTITFRNGSNTADKCYSAASNYNNVMDGTNESLKNVMGTMYNYSKSVAAYEDSKKVGA